MPSAHDLPDDLQELTQLEALKLDDTRWRDDVERLVRIIRNERRRPGWPSRLRAFAASHRWPVVVAAAMGILLVIGLALLLSRPRPSPDDLSTSPLPLASGSPPCADSYFEGIRSSGSGLWKREPPI